MKRIFSVFLALWSLLCCFGIYYSEAFSKKIETNPQIVGRIVNKNKDKTHICNFFAISETEILTAGHCVIGVDFMLVINETRFLTFSNTQMNIKASFDDLEDWALIKINDPYTKINDLKIFQRPSPNSDIPTKFKIAGYMGKDPKRLIIRNCSLFEDRGKVFLYNCDGELFEGMSGGPVYSEDGIVWGIHTHISLNNPDVGAATKLTSLTFFQ